MLLIDLLLPPNSDSLAAVTTLPWLAQTIESAIHEAVNENRRHALDWPIRLRITLEPSSAAAALQEIGHKSKEGAGGEAPGQPSWGFFLVRHSGGWPNQLESAGQEGHGRAAQESPHHLIELLVYPEGNVAG